MREVPLHTFELAFESGIRRCRVRAGAGALDRVLDELGEAPPARRLFLVSDSNGFPLHGDPLAQRLAGAGFDVTSLTFPAGEASKNRRTKAELEDRLFELEAARDCALIAVGGGVTGDLAGFVAATWHRGVPVVQVPTTLLSMVDASLGGKTGVNLSYGKNLIGAFHQPWGVYADVATLRTLPEYVYREGFAEAIKTAFIADAGLFDFLDERRDALFQREPEALTELTGRCMKIKGEISMADEREGGKRAMLNFGHTVAHAIEAASDFGVSHGDAVAAGMAVEARLAMDRLDMPARDVQRLDELLQAYGLPVAVPQGLEPAALLSGARRDKKNRAGELRVAVPAALGCLPEAADPTLAVADDAFLQALQTGRG